MALSLRFLALPKRKLTLVSTFTCQHVRKAHSKATHHIAASLKPFTPVAKGVLSSLKETITPAKLDVKADCLHRMTTTALLRSIILGSLLTSTRLMRVGLPLMDRIANSKSLLLSPNRNPLLRSVVKPLIYNHFCAGENQAEVRSTRGAIKGMGYSGVILCPGQEVQVAKNGELRSTQSASENEEIEQWSKGTLQTLEMIGEGDWVGIKLTGAGTKVTQALMHNKPPPAEFSSAMHEICARAAKQNCRIWIDAEQQVLQSSIDAWTIDLMRRWNSSNYGHNGALVYNTLQAYLKSSRSKLRHQLLLSQSEGWTLGMKLVRGAYISNDQREKIHDSKQNTDDSYNGIMADILSGENLGWDSPEQVPRMELFLAGHNPESVGMAARLVEQLQEQGKLNVMPDFGQLQGMGDVLGCELLARGEETMERRKAEAGLMSEEPTHAGVLAVPKVYKCLTWGSVQECIQFLLRRMVENSGASERMKDGLSAYSGELRRRLSQAFRPAGR